MLARDEEIGKAERAKQARIEAQNEAVWAQEMLEKAHKARGCVRTFRLGRSGARRPSLCATQPVNADIALQS